MYCAESGADGAGRALRRAAASARLPLMPALIFDFDGLMVDTEWPAFEAWSAIYREHGAELRLDRWVECVGSSNARFDPVQHLCELTGRTLDGPALVADKERRKASICDALGVMPGVEAQIAAARGLGWKVAVASSSGARWVRGHLERLALTARFDAILTREDVARVKPAPDLYLKAAEVLGVAPAQCVVLEDSLNGVRAAKAAGMRCFAVPNRVTRGLDFAEADAVLASVQELPLAQLAKDTLAKESDRRTR
jgi:putative hydrolase of the HAD superfamily